MTELGRDPYARAAARVCRAWGLSDSEAEALLRRRGHARLVIGINALLETLYSPPLPAQWMTIPNKNPAIGGSPECPVRPVDHAIADPAGLEAVWDLLRGYAEGE